MFSRRIGYLVPLLGGSLVLAASTADCGFPTYEFGSVGGAAGSAGNAGSAGSSGSGGAGPGGSGGVSGAGASAGRGGESGGSAGTNAPPGGDAGTAGEAGAPCVYPAPVAFPAHCFDKTKDGGESDVDCGGTCGPCAGTEACTAASDCSSQSCGSDQKCAPYLSMNYMSIVADAFTHTVKFSIELNYLRANKFLRFQDLHIRYYFDHDAVNEPVIAPDTQATYHTGQQQTDLKDMRYRVFRTLRGPANENDIVTDSYLDISFGSAASMSAGDSINLNQDIVGGTDSNSQFQESTHYSFMQTGAPAPNNRIAIFEGDTLVWGMPPALAEIPECAFETGVSLNGPALTVDGHDLTAGASAGITYTGMRYQNSLTPAPVTDANTVTLLHTGFNLQSDTATWTAPNGQYWAYAWLLSNVSSMSGTLMIQDTPTDKFESEQLSVGPVWQKIGPYAIVVSNNQVKLNATGAIQIAGLELYRATP